MNAKEELLKFLKDKAPLKCAIISAGNTEDTYKGKFVLKLKYKLADYKKFLNKINFEYDNGQGGQELFGIVWLTDGTWLTRGEYEDPGYDDDEYGLGFEFWEHNLVPDVYAECL